MASGSVNSGLRVLDIDDLSLLLRWNVDWLLSDGDGYRLLGLWEHAAGGQVASHSESEGHQEVDYLH